MKLKLLSKAICSAFTVSVILANQFSYHAFATSVSGDVDDDNFVAMSDVIRLGRYLNGCELTSNVNLLNADVDQNTVLDTNDLQLVVKYLSGMIVSLPYNPSDIVLILCLQTNLEIM